MDRRRKRRWDGRPSRFVRRLALDCQELGKAYDVAPRPLKALAWAISLVIISLMFGVLSAMGLKIPAIDPLEKLIHLFPPAT